MTDGNGGAGGRGNGGNSTLLVNSSISGNSSGYSAAENRISSGDSAPCADLKWAASVEFYAHDVKVRRKLVNRQTRIGTGGNTSREGKRGAITKRSDKSRARLLFALRNFTAAAQWAVLTYPAAYPVDGQTVKAHWAALRKWLTARGIGGVWAIEFQGRGAVHFNIVMNGRVSRQELAARWYAIVGNGNPRHKRGGAQVQDIYNERGLASYISKAGQSDVPEGFQNIGRFWGAFGGYKTAPVAVVTGEQAELAPVVRAVKGAERARRRQRISTTGKRPPRRFDNGLTGFTSYDTSAPIRARLPELCGGVLQSCQRRRTVPSPAPAHCSR